MPAKSAAQRRFMAMCEHGKSTRGNCPDMSKEEMRKFASTSERGLPKRKTRKRKMYGGR